MIVIQDYYQWDVGFGDLAQVFKFNFKFNVAELLDCFFDVLDYVFWIHVNIFAQVRIVSCNSNASNMI